MRNSYKAFSCPYIECQDGLQKNPSDFGEKLMKTVIVLVDCGTSHNFISAAVVKKQQIPVTTMVVKLAS